MPNLRSVASPTTLTSMNHDWTVSLSVPLDNPLTKIVVFSRSLQSAHDPLKDAPLKVRVVRGLWLRLLLSHFGFLRRLRRFRLGDRR